MHTIGRPHGGALDPSRPQEEAPRLAALGAHMGGPRDPSPSQQHARPPVTNDAPLRWGLVRPNFLSLWLSPPGVFFHAVFYKNFFEQIFARREWMTHWTNRSTAGQLGISVEEYEGCGRLE
jgi:hypothetical protein